jgi:hypothetical protein
VGQQKLLTTYFFECPVTKVVGGLIAICFNQNNMPSSYEEYETWIKKSLPHGENIYMFGPFGK